jgi:hypothetical protein
MSLFLDEILGAEGSKTLDKVIEHAPMLKSVIVPRAVFAWLSTMGNLGYEGELPGMPDSYFSLSKTEENDFSGALTIQDQLYTFENANLMHVAASVGVALGIDVDPINEQLKKKDLTQLGKSVDLLVKSEIIKRIRRDQEKKKLTKEQKELSGISSPPNPPKGALPPEVPKAPQTQTSMNGGSIPVNKPNIALGQGNQKLKVTKNESERPCEECGGHQFNNSRFVGCLCLIELSKNVSSEVIDDGYLLKFKNLDEDAISTLIETLKF